jgi:hypothetical protein|nr:hypothetical protein [Kofleriaceae bacterium]
MTRTKTILSFVAAAALAGCMDPGTGAGAADNSSDDGITSDTASPNYPTAHPRVYLNSTQLSRLKTSVSAKTATWTTFKGVVDKWKAGDDIWGFDEWNAALITNLTGDTSYCTKAIATSDAQVAAAETAEKADTAPVVAGDDYLQIGPMVGNVALVYDWCYSQVTSSQRTRWIAYMNQAVYNVWNPTKAAWGGHAMAWNGWATNDPSDNYYYSFLRATMLVGLATRGDNSEADQWLTQFRTTKLYDQAFPTFDDDLIGGGSREGTSYGVAMRGLWELYDWWQTTTGESLATQTPHTLKSLLTGIHQTVPTLDRVAPTGDQARDSTATFFDYNRQYLAELAQIFPTDKAAGVAKTLIGDSNVPYMSEEFMAAYDFIYDDSTVKAAPLTNLNTAYYASGIGELYARSGWTDHDSWVNLIGGPYTESHAHQDQGSLMFYKDGWLIADAVIGSHSGLRQETTAHGLVRIDSSNGGAPIAQVPTTTSQLVALHSGPGYLHAAVDVTAAYNGNSKIQKVVREMIYLQPDVVVVYDRVESSTGTEQTFQLPSPVKPTISGADATFTTSTHALHVHRSIPASGATASAYSMTSDASGDYSTGYRLDDKLAGGNNRFLHVLSVDGAVKSLVDGTDRVTLHLASGQTVACVFSHDKVGGKIEINGVTYTLPAGVDTLPE